MICSAASQTTLLAQELEDEWVECLNLNHTSSSPLPSRTLLTVQSYFTWTRTYDTPRSRIIFMEQSLYPSQHAQQRSYENCEMNFGSCALSTTNKCAPFLRYCWRATDWSELRAGKGIPFSNQQQSNPTTLTISKPSRRLSAPTVHVFCCQLHVGLVNGTLWASLSEEFWRLFYTIHTVL